MDTKQIELLLKARGFKFVKSLGQNFLMNEAVLAAIADEALPNAEPVLEIGSGAGCLTKELAKRSKKVLAIEIDKNVVPVLETVLGGEKNTVIVQGDALRLDLAALCKEHLGDEFVVAANLPYGITTQILQILFAMPAAKRLTLMLQKEAVERILSGPGSKEYGPLGVMCRYLFDYAPLFDVDPQSFLPPPHIDSTVLRLVRKENIDDAKAKALWSLVKTAFSMRRKTLSNNLSSKYGKEESLRMLEEAGLAANLRAEALSLEDFLALLHAEK